MTGLQWIARSQTAAHSVFGDGSLQLTMTVRPADWFRVFVEAQGGVGAGPDTKLGTLSRLNNRAGDLEGKEEAARLMKAVLESSWLDDRLRLIVGKLDVTDYFDRNAFAEDEQEHFLGSAFVVNPMMKQPTNGPGAVVRVAVADWRWALGVHGLADVDGDLSGVPFIVAEIGRRNLFARPGTYRLWARVASVAEDRGRLTWGAGVSADQFVTPEIGVFLRGGVSRAEGEHSTSYAWSAGVRLTPTWLGRDRDTLAVGFSELREPEGRERVVEAYYRWQVFSRLAVFANVEWVISGPNTVAGGTNRNVIVPGLRAVAAF
jgi:carbohydrate-selective porin OprB